MAALATVNNMGACAHNPRGNLWFNDQSTYGHKLLMKMGWSKGKGLGKNEDGIKENLSVKYRNTNSGLGYKDDSYSVIKTDYESILKSLSANYSQNETCVIEEEDNKGEKKSCERKVVKNRLRYPKLFFGKDVTKYSEQDMKSIFICSLPSKEKQENPGDPGLSKKQSEIELPDVEKTYSSTLSISDYFAKKMKEKKNSENSKAGGSVVSSEQMLAKGENNEEINSGAEYGNDTDLQQNESETKVVETAENFNTSRKKSSKKRKRKSEISIDETDSADIRDKETGYIFPNKKKQKLSVDVCEENDPEIEISEIGKSVIVNSSKLDKKKGKSKFCEYENSSIYTCANEGKISCQIELSPRKALQLKKKHKKKYGNIENIFRDTRVLTTENSSVTNGHSSLKSAENELINNDVICSKKKKKKNKFKKLKSCLKSKTGNYSLKNVSFNENVSYRVIGTNYESVEYLSKEGSTLHNSLTNEAMDSDDDYNSVNNNSEIEEVKIDLDEESKGDCSLSLPESSDAEVKEVVLHEEVRENCSTSSLPTSSGAEVQEIVLGEAGKLSLSSLPLPNSYYFNSWVESQRQALKMKMYKNMLKSIKKHKVLKTSNLLSIKGYGNWGFQ